MKLIAQLGAFFHIVFDHEEFCKVRTVLNDEKPYAVGNDVARALGYKRPYEAITSHCKGVVSYRVLTKGGIQETKVIPEGDIYRLIIKAADQSKNEDIQKKAKIFERWIFDEVLPSIRNHGLYATDEIIKCIINNPEIGIQLLTKYKEEEDKRRAQEENTRGDQRLY